MSRLTEAQIATLRPSYVEYPERRLILPAYPPARRKRGLSLAQQQEMADDPQGALPAGGLTGAPSVKFWSVGLFTNLISHYIQRGSPRFVGPALLHSFTGAIVVNAAANPLTPLQITISESPVPQADSGTATSRPPGSPLSSASARRIAINTTLNQESGFIFSNDFTSNPFTLPLGVYISKAEWYIGISIYADANAGYGLTGAFRIIENAPPESVAWI